MPETQAIWDEVTEVTEGGEYGSYRYRADDGGVGLYIWAHRVEDYGHRVFGTIEEARSHVNSRADD